MEIISTSCAFLGGAADPSLQFANFAVPHFVQNEILITFQNVNLRLHLSRSLRIVGFALCVFLAAPVCFADDKPRVTITVTRKSVGRPASKTVGGGETGRPQSLIVGVENLSIRTLPEGSLHWTAVVRKYSGGSFKYSGAEPVKSLKSFQSAEIHCGLFEIDTRPSVTSLERDRIDYEMVYLVEDKEIARSVSVSNFAVLALKAEPVTPEVAAVAAKPDDAAPPKKPADEKPAPPAIIGAEKMPPPKPALPAAAITKPADEPPPPQQPFDFFNLSGKKLPAAK